MNSNRLSSAAQRAGLRYKVFLTGLESLFIEFSLSPNPGSSSVKVRATARGYELANSYLAEEIFVIKAAVTQESEDAVQVTLRSLDISDTETDSDVVEHTDAIAVELEGALRVQLERDIAAMCSELRHTALRAQLTASAGGITRKSALAAMRSASPTFQFTDRVGKRWASEKYIRTVWRLALVMAWNETAMLTMAERGVVQATIEHSDESFTERGTVISLADSTTSVMWDQVRDDVFHPNTSAWLSPVI